jgi:hypothetical protein
MGGLVGLLFGLAAGLWAAKWLLIPAVVVGVVWLLAWVVKRQGERDLAERLAREAAERELAERMWEQHNQVMRADPRGMYGVALPAMRKFARVNRRRSP